VSALFNYLLGLDGMKLSGIGQRLLEHWGEGVPTVSADEFADLHSEIGSGDPALGDRWVAIATTLASADYSALIRLLLEQNQQVTVDRGGTPWAEVRDGKLHVRFRDEQGVLPPRGDLPTMWRYSYFIDSLRNIALALKED